MSSMWDPQRAPVSSRKPPSPRPEATMSASSKSSAQDAIYRCDCGDPEASEKWIRCDGDDCLVEWYHWECVQVTDEPAGDWFCPKCSQYSQEKAQLLHQPRERKTSVLPNLGKTAAARSTGTVNGKNKSGNPVAVQGHVRVKKGTAVKKPTPKKTRRTEWVEITSEDEDDEERIERETLAQGAVTGEREARTKARATPPNQRRQASSKRAVKPDENMRGFSRKRGTNPLPAHQFEPAR